MRIKKMYLDGKRAKRLDEFEIITCKFAKPVKVDIDNDFLGNKILRISNENNFISVDFDKMKEVIEYFEDVNFERIEESQNND